MKYLSVLGIFGFSIWAAPNAAPWWFRAFIIAWGFYLTRKMLNEGSQN